MGTSHSYSLTPNWKGARLAMTNYLKQEDKVKKDAALDKYLSIFYKSVFEASSGTILKGSGLSNFGHSGVRIAQRVQTFFQQTKIDGLENAISYLAGDSNQTSLKELTGAVLLTKIFEIISGGDNATFDDNAAKCALQQLLINIFQDCEDIDSIEKLIQDVSEEQIKEWIINFYVDYIVEYNEIILSSHIFSKSKDPKAIAVEIKNYLKGCICSCLNDDLKRLDIFSSEGESYMNQLLVKILQIWAE